MTTTYVSKFDIAHPGEGHQDPATYHWVYTVDGQPMKWTNREPLPALGTKIKVTMNSIGSALVVGYFYEQVNEGAYIGVMTLPLNPPKWLKDQLKASAHKADKPLWWRAGVGCTYGMECEK